MEKITLLSLVAFTETQLAKLQAVSPRLEVQQMTGASFEEMPEALRQRVEILYDSSHALAEAHRLPRLKWMQTHSAGVDFLLDQPIWQSQVLLTSLNGVHAVPIAEHALAMMLALCRKLPIMWRLQQRQEWPKDRWDIFSRPELRGSTLGIVGYGTMPLFV